MTNWRTNENHSAFGGYGGPAGCGLGSDCPGLDADDLHVAGVLPGPRHAPDHRVRRAGWSGARPRARCPRDRSSPMVAAGRLSLRCRSRRWRRGSVFAPAFWLSGWAVAGRGPRVLRWAGVALGAAPAALLWATSPAQERELVPAPTFLIGFLAARGRDGLRRFAGVPPVAGTPGAGAEPGTAGRVGSGDPRWLRCDRVPAWTMVVTLSYLLTSVASALAVVLVVLVVVHLGVLAMSRRWASARDLARHARTPFRLLLVVLALGQGRGHDAPRRRGQGVVGRDPPGSAADGDRRGGVVAWRPCCCSWRTWD